MKGVPLRRFLFRSLQAIKPGTEGRIHSLFKGLVLSLAQALKSCGDISVQGDCGAHASNYTHHDDIMQHGSQSQLPDATHPEALAIINAVLRFSQVHGRQTHR